MASDTPGIVHNVNVLTTAWNPAVGQRDSLTGQIQKFHIQFRPARLVAGPLRHSWIRFECIDLAHFSGVIAREVHTRPDADLLRAVLSL
jgi:hypothetical protein